MQNGARTPYYSNGTDMNLDYFGLRSPSRFSSLAGAPSSSYEDPLSQYGSSILVPPSDVLLEGHKAPLSEPYDDAHDAPRTPRGPRLRSSAPLYANDPVAMHLLVETAIGDSQAYEVLSFEDLEALKKEQTGLASRIDGVRRKLVLESKVRDAAQSLNRLYSKRSKAIDRPSPKHRRSFGSTKGSGENVRKDAAVRSEDELAASSKKCDELSRELYQLEIQFNQGQTRLLKHNAGILQLTHSRPFEESQGLQPLSPEGVSSGAMPDSPVSIHTYETGKARVVSIGPDKFDERSLYRLPEYLDGVAETDARPKSKWAQTLSRITPTKSKRSSLGSGLQSLALTTLAQRLTTLNGRVRELLVQADPERYQSYPAAPKPEPKSSSAINEQLEYLDQGLSEIMLDQTALQQKRYPEDAIEDQLEGINSHIYSIINRSYPFEDGDYPRPPQVSGEGPQGQLKYAEDGVFNLQQIHQSLLESVECSRSESANHRDRATQYEIALASLWQTLLASEKKACQQRHYDTQDGDSEEEAGDDETDTNEEFTPQAFSNKVQWLCDRAARLQERQTLLQQQLLEQRELHSDSSTEKESQVATLQFQLSQSHEAHSTTQLALELATSQLDNHNATSAQRDALLAALTTELQQARSNHAAAERELSDLSAHLSQLRRSSSAHSDALDAFRQREAQLLADLQARRDQVESLEAYMAGAVRAEHESRKAAEEQLTAELGRKDRELGSLQARITEAKDGAQATRVQWEAQATALREEVQRATALLDEAGKARESAEAKSRLAEAALREKESELVTLRTEITVARAELDGAYGSRAERAAEVAASADRDVKARLDQAAGRETRLREELEGMLGETEELARACVEAERERERLETLVDGLRERCEGLEGALSEERIAGAGAKDQSTSVGVLKTEFKRMVREARAENSRVLRAEREERRKLEALVRALRREQQASGKSSLSQSRTAMG